MMPSPIATLVQASSRDIPAINPNKGSRAMLWQERAAGTLASHIPAGSRVLAAVSGGPDSVALAHFLRRQPYFLRIGHVDHALRRNSAQDARFVKRLAHEWDIPYIGKRVHVRAYAKTHRIGLEEAARALRYESLTAMAERAKCTALVTAHTADDQAETVMMNFLRGAGTTGLSGMASARRLDRHRGVLLVRPFLRVQKQKILNYLKTHKLSYRRDPT